MKGILYRGSYLEVGGGKYVRVHMSNDSWTEAGCQDAQNTEEH